ncbi:hypothetical protein V4F39_21855, partial [Aquincola sp. MAHUQ-54]
MLAWAMGGAGTAAPFVRQTTDPLLTVTGGHMLELNNRMQLIMGNNFVGEYLPTRSGTYTRQIRGVDGAGRHRPDRRTLHGQRRCRDDVQAGLQRLRNRIAGALWRGKP